MTPFRSRTVHGGAVGASLVMDATRVAESHERTKTRRLVRLWSRHESGKEQGVPLALEGHFGWHPEARAGSKERDVRGLRRTSQPSTRESDPS
jgi:hypothetical protein